MGDDPPGVIDTLDMKYHLLGIPVQTNRQCASSLSIRRPTAKNGLSCRLVRAVIVRLHSLFAASGDAQVDSFPYTVDAA